MEIELLKVNNEQWYLTSDSRNFILATKEKREIIKEENGEKIKTGEFEDWLRSEFFYNSLVNALEGFAMMKIKMSDIKNFSEFASELRSFNEYLKSIQETLLLFIEVKSE